MVWLTRTTSSAERGRRTEAIRARLHEDRLAAYREFAMASRDFSGARRRRGNLGEGHAGSSGILRASSGSERAKATELLDEVDKRHERALVNARESADRLAQASIVLEMVASGPVAKAATQVQRAAEEEAVARSNAAVIGEKDDIDAAWKVWDEKSRELDGVRRALQDAIRTELQVDA